MTKMNRLKKEARECCEFRGHNMRRFKTMDSHRAITSCKVCDRLVRVDTKPLPNDIDISGEAVALECINRG